jgi:hypothetical protein
VEEVFRIQRSAARETGLMVVVGMIKPVAAEDFALSTDELLTITVESNPQPIDLGHLKGLPLSTRRPLKS